MGGPFQPGTQYAALSFTVHRAGCGLRKTGSTSDRPGTSDGMGSCVTKRGAFDDRR